MTSETIASIQRALIAAGYDVGPDGADGQFGANTQNALLAFQVARGLHTSGQPDEATMAKLFPTKPKGNIMGNWLSGFVATTGFKYLVTIVATFIASKLGVDHGTIEGILTQLIAVVMGAWGVWESSRSKIVMNGAKVQVSDLSPAQKATVSAIVEDKK